MQVAKNQYATFCEWYFTASLRLLVREESDELVDLPVAERQLGHAGVGLHGIGDR